MKIEMIVAMGKDRSIGKDNTLLWHCPQDMKRFKTLTMGNTVLMGRNTWESLPKQYRPLPGRYNIVLTRNPNYVAIGAVVETSIENLDQYALEKLQVIGGAEIYNQMISKADIIHATVMNAAYPDADSHFPELGPEWKETAREDYDEFSFITLEKV